MSKAREIIDNAAFEFQNIDSFQQTFFKFKQYFC